MLLAIDVGNTQTVVGVFSPARPEASRTPRRAGELPGLAHHWRVSTLPDRTADEHALLLRDLLSLAGIPLPSARPVPGAPSEAAIEGIALSSSVPPVTGVLREMVERWFDVPLVVVEPGIKTGMPVLYENPREVGADRVVNAVAALDLHGAPAIVVDLGTATTFDAISSAGEYLGGAIVPGVEISMDALFAHAAALRRVELVEPRHAIGRTTAESMQAGAIFGYAALVDGLCARIEAELGKATVISTGGLAGLISPYAASVQYHEPWLTLHGLRLLYARNTTEEAPA
jgi:type III pantothenate kinase